MLLLLLPSSLRHPVFRSLWKEEVLCFSVRLAETQSLTLSGRRMVCRLPLDTGTESPGNKSLVFLGNCYNMCLIYEGIITLHTNVIHKSGSREHHLQYILLLLLFYVTHHPVLYASIWQIHTKWSGSPDPPGMEACPKVVWLKSDFPRCQ